MNKYLVLEYNFINNYKKNKIIVERRKKMKILIKSFRNIVNEISLELEKNKVTTIIGNNGVGKSNILKAINFFQESYKQTDVSFTPNFEGNEDKIINKKAVVIKHPLSESIKIDLLKNLKNIGIEIPEIKEKIIFWETEKNNNGKLWVGEDLYLIFEKIFNKKSKILSEKYYSINEETGHYWPNFDQIDRSIENRSLQNGQVIKPILEIIKNIHNLFVSRMKIVYIDNANKEFDLEHLTDIMDINEKGRKSEKVLELLNFIGGKALEDAKIIYSINSQSSIEINRVDNAKKRIIYTANKKVLDIFNYFDLYAEPFFQFDGTKISLSLNFNKDTLYGEGTNLDLNSSGFKSILHFLIKFEYAIEFSKNNNTEYIIIADEIDKNIHPILQMQLLNYIKEKIANSGIYLVFSSHSPFMIELNSDFSNFYIVNKKKDGSVELSKKNQLNDNLISSFLVLSRKVLDSHDYLMHLNSKRLVIIESSDMDDIQIIKAKINKRIANVDYVIKNKKNNILDKDIQIFIKTPKDLDKIEDYLIEHKKVLIKKELMEKFRNEE